MSIDLNKMAQEFAQDSRSDVTPVECHWFARQVAEAVLDGFHAYATEHLEYSYGQCLERYKREICGNGNVAFVTSEV